MSSAIGVGFGDAGGPSRTMHGASVQALHDHVVDRLGRDAGLSLKAAVDGLVDERHVDVLAEALLPLPRE